MYRNCIKNILNRNCKICHIYILIFGFVLRILLYFNTNEFAKISEASSILNGIETLNKDGQLWLYIGNYTFGLSYIGYFFKYSLNCFPLFFVFQAFLNTLSTYLVYLIIKKLTATYLSAIIGLILSTLYLDFLLLSSIAYNQSMEVFFTLTSILLTINIIKCERFPKFFLYSLLLVINIYISLLFRGTLKYYGLLIFISAIIIGLHDKNRSIFLRLTFSSLLCILILFFAPYKYFAKPSEDASNNFLFFGHTLYGGHGGEGSFVYKENSDLYNQNLLNYKKERKIDSISQNDINRFQRNEIYEFIKKSPHKWMLLQIKKIAYTYSIIPIRDNLTILLTGKAEIGLFLSIFILQLSYILPIMTLIFLFNKNKFLELLRSQVGKYMLLMFLYLIIATSIYGHYQERYRIVVMLSSIIPIGSYFYNSVGSCRITAHFSIEKITILIIILSTWSYQIYEALVLEKERYMQAIELIKGL